MGAVSTAPLRFSLTAAMGLISDSFEFVALEMATAVGARTFLAITSLHLLGVVVLIARRLGRWFFNRANDYLVIRHETGPFIHQPLDDADRERENDWVKQLKKEVKDAVSKNEQVILRYFEVGLPGTWRVRIECMLCVFFDAVRRTSRVVALTPNLA